MRRRLSLLPLVLIAAVAIVPAARASAQQADRVTGGAATDSSRFLSGAESSAGVVAARTAAVAVRAVPNSIHVVEIPVPAELRDAPRIRYLVFPSGFVPLLGSRGGELTGSDSTGAPGSVLISFSVPKRARAGTLEIARIRFSTTPGDVIDVPVEVVVEPVRTVELMAGEALRGVRPGDRFQLSWRVVNLGNQVEELEVRAMVPAGWRVASGNGVVVPVAINGTAERTIEVSVPFTSATGSAMIRLVALRDGVPVATAMSRVDVLPEGEYRSSQGPRLTTGLSVGGSAAGFGTGYTARLEGPLTRGVSVSASISDVDAPSIGGLVMLSQLGHYRRPATLSLRAAAWDVTVGQASAQLTDLTGMNASGSGAAASLRGSGVGFTALAARPDYGWGQRGEGELLGAKIEAAFGPARVSAAGAHLADGLGFRRELDAISLGLALAGPWRGSLAAELGQRWHSEGAGLGFGLTWGHQAPRHYLAVKVVHAPGGSRAWARASNELGISGGQQVTDWFGLRGSYWHSRDGAALTGSQFSSDGWSAGGTLVPGRGMRIGLGARGSEYRMRSAHGSYGTTESGFETTLDARIGAFTAAAGGTVSSYSRNTMIGDDRLTEEAIRLGLRGSAGIGGSAGTVVATAQVQEAVSGDATVPRQTDIELRLDRVPLVSAGRSRVLLGGAVRQVSLPGFGISYFTSSASITAELPLGASVGLHAERNPYFFAGEGGNGWVYALKVERVTALPGWANDQTQGLVYQDLNGNGRQDRGEPGQPGVVVRRGGESTVTDDHGRYRLPGTGTTPVTLDPLSLNAGWLVGLESGESRRWSHAVVPVAPVEVRLEVLAGLKDIGLQVLERAVVLARHTSGRVWVGRRAAEGLVVFDALPAGRYRIELDLADVREPLEIDGGGVEFATTGRETTTVSVRVRSKPFTIRQLDAPKSETRQGPAQ